MARIVIENWAEKSIEVTDLTKPLLRHFHDQGLDWMHACGGKGRCTTCKVIVKEGADNFKPLSPAEIRFRDMGALLPNERLSCQTRITGDIRVSMPEESKLPHINYNNI